ncbi:MAG: ribonuclease HII [archaeon]|nr:ribonuclease HII [archaeon]
MIVAGVDEAGRGSVLGPLVVAGVAIEERDIPKLKALGVKDSKLLLPPKRRKLVRDIKKLAVQIAWEKIEPRRIDAVVTQGFRLFRLNYLEAQYMARVLERLKFDLAYVDCCDTIQKRYGNLVADLLFERIKEKTNATVELGETNKYRKKIVSEHHADANYPVVSAASIVAKVRRDACISLLHRKHGIFGSGYPSDPDTKKYLRGFVERAEILPSITRLSWVTIRNLYQPVNGQIKPINEFSRD